VFFTSTQTKRTTRFFFYKDGYNQIDLPPSDWNQWNSKSWWFEAETGGLILFPSSLEHMVQCVTAENERISIAFNTFLKGAVGDNKELTELKLGI
jgi:hypothetical protein